MSFTKDKLTKLVHAHFFFVDIVGLSDPYMSTKTQIKKINTLNKCISETETFQATPKEMTLLLPTGDGMCLGFYQGPELPLHLAIELQEKLTEHNRGLIPSETVRVRIGLHSGNCFIVKDIKGQNNVWGPGIILARRVMDFGDDNHILLTPQLAEDLRELSDDYRKIIKPVHDFEIKHGKSLLIYSAHGQGFGNSMHPSKGEALRSKYGEEIIRMQKTTLYSNLAIELSLLNSENSLVKHRRTYDITNISDEPIRHVLHGIATDINKYSINDLDVQVVDEFGREMKISSINVDKPDCKEFTTQFNTPILKGEKDRKYTLSYQVEEPKRYFENAFLIDVENLELRFKYPADAKCNPQIYYVNQETEEKTKSDIQPEIQKIGDYFVAKYERHENIKGDTIRLEW